MSRLFRLASPGALLAAAALSAVAVAQVPTPNNQADITHQEIQDVHNAGAVGGVNGYAWGSFTCNIGSDSLTWVNGNSPALGMNAYRLYDVGGGAGMRLVQVGLGFCKHACCVANGAGCGGTCVSTGGAGLRAGCRDIYSGGFNAGQTRLGPRSGINPFLGTFTPIGALPGGSSAITRKVQVPQTEMNAAAFPNALYFAEGVYVCAEEKEGAQLNNATYRRMNVANAGATPTYAWTVASGTGGASMAGVPAIEAWRAHGRGLNMQDTSVAISIVDVPSEGRFYVAGKAVDLSGTAGTGPWRYEYAVFNLNSARAGGSLTVPVPTSSTVTDIGFRDVNYHSGEIYDNTDWIGTKVGPAVRFASTTTHATNAAGNAVRWGTMYNFWFTADVAPAAAPGSVALGLYVPGTPAEIVATGLPVPMETIPCAADFNGANGLTLQDLFDFLDAYFRNDVRADYNGAGGVDIQDVWDYLGGYFVGC